MSYIITDDKHYKNIAKSLRSKMQTDREYYPEDMALAIDNIPSSADGTDNPITGIYFLNPDVNGLPTEIKVINSEVTTFTQFSAIIPSSKLSKIRKVSFLNCNISAFPISMFSGFSDLMNIEFPEGLKNINMNCFVKCTSLKELYLPNGITSLPQNCLGNCTNLEKLFIPSSITSVNNLNPMAGCSKLNEVTLGDNFNCANLNLSSGSKYTRETILQWLNALADRTGQTAYKLTIGATNLAKLTEEDILIATNKNWTLS